jgi:hypothetical protein
MGIKNWLQCFSGEVPENQAPITKRELPNELKK